jgi:hypothetical protein
MRPVDKPKPTTPPTGDSAPKRKRPPLDPLTVWRMALQDTINVNQAVASKSLRTLKRSPGLDTWDDLLLACDYCQLHRTADATALSQYLWPDTDATFSLGSTSPFLYALKDVTYIVTGDNVGAPITRPLVIVSANPASPSASRAQKTIDLFQLNTPFYDANTNTLTISQEALQSQIDPRLDRRTAGWRLAQQSIEALQTAKQMTDVPVYFAGLTKMAAATAQASGFWSVWMTTVWQAFSDSRLIRALLLDVDNLDGYQVVGYQTLPDGGSPPWRLFTGTAISRLNP